MLKPGESAYGLHERPQKVMFTAECGHEILTGEPCWLIHHGNCKTTVMCDPCHSKDDQ